MQETRHHCDRSRRDFMNDPETPPARPVFFVSDRTGITAETLGHSLLTQFNGIEFQRITVPFIDTEDKARDVVERIAGAGREAGMRPLVFSTLVDDDIRTMIESADCLCLDFFDAFIGPLEREMHTRSSHATGRAHGVQDTENYARRIDAMNFALAHDDGASIREYEKAEVILIGVSRSGKTPTCLYLALHYGIYAANCPLTEDDLEVGKLPNDLERYRDRLFGLTIDPVRRKSIRQERRPDSRYSSTRQVHYEVKEAEAMLRRHNVPFLNTTRSSVEEIATTVLQESGLRRRLH
jgi:[pyruvate, water dikinase]-phosphate phosphotransferase / [pyruvate, water dikinase] kinase